MGLAHQSSGFLKRALHRSVRLRHLLVYIICLCGIEVASLPAATGADNTTARLVDYEPNIPIVFLKSTNQVVGDRDRKVPCTVKILYPAGAKEQSTKRMPAVVRFHGASSQAYPKKSFAFALETPASLLGMRESPHWILNAA